MEVPSCARHLPPTHTQADAARGGEAEAPGAAAQEVRAYVACASRPALDPPSPQIFAQAFPHGGTELRAPPAAHAHAG